MAILAAALGAVPLATSSTPAAAAGTCTKVVTFQSKLLPADSNGATGCIMGVGNTGAAVKELRRTLNACYQRKLTVDGIFGSHTRDALVAVQNFEGTDPDGVYGPKTRDAIQHPFAFDPSLCNYL